MPSLYVDGLLSTFTTLAGACAHDHLSGNAKRLATTDGDTPMAISRLDAAMTGADEFITSRGRRGHDAMAYRGAVVTIIISIASAASAFLVSAVAAVASFAHVYGLAHLHGQGHLVAMLLPLSVDGTVAMATLSILRAARNSYPVTIMAKVSLVIGVLATLAANAASGAHYGPIGIFVATWPAVAFVCSVEMAASMVKKVSRNILAGVDLLPPELRENIQVNEETGCWEWQGEIDKGGYGIIYDDVTGRHRAAHRVVYAFLCGPIPDGLTLDHVKTWGCKSKACCWPLHLEAVTRSENSKRVWHPELATWPPPRPQPRLARTDKENAALAALASRPDMTHKQLAGAIGVSERTARRVRARLNGQVATATSEVAL